MKVKQLKEVLQEMEKGESFSITFIKADRQRDTGGAIVSYENCKLYKKATTTGKENSKSSNIPDSRNPSHFKHGTRNLLLQNGEIKKIHIRLIVKFNGYTVIY